MKTRIFSLLLCLALLLPVLSLSEEEPVEYENGEEAWASGLQSLDLPRNLSAIGERAFQNLDEVYDVSISKNIKSIGANAFSGTDVAVLRFERGASVQPEISSFDWGEMDEVYLYREPGGDPLYDFFSARRKEQEEEGHELRIVHTDPAPAISVHSNTKVAFGDTDVVLEVKSSNLDFSAHTFQWQQSLDGETWENIGEDTAEGWRYAFDAAAPEETARLYYRALATGTDGEKIPSENTVIIDFVTEEDLALDEDEITCELDEEDETTVHLSWTESEKVKALEERLEYAVYLSLPDEDEDEDGEPDEVLIEDGITTDACTVELLGEDTEYEFIVRASSPGREVVCNRGKKVTTGKSGDSSKPRYRALLISEVDFKEKCTRNDGNVKLMQQMLKRVKGTTNELEPGLYSVAVRKNPSKNQILQAIRQTFRGATANDVSLVFIATHGNTSLKGEKAGALCTLKKTANGYVNGPYLYLYELRDALLQIPGRVDIFLASCGSGAAVISDAKAAEMDSRSEDADAEYDPEAFAKQAVQVFSEAAEDGELDPRTGELRQYKFRVLTAANYHETGWGSEKKGYNYFTKGLVNGVQWGAEADEKGRVTLEALYRYLKRTVDPVPRISMDDGKTYYQHVQVWPEYWYEPMFVRPED